MTIKISPAAEECIVIEVADRQSESVLNRIQCLSEMIVTELGHCVVDIVPSFTTIAVYYDILACDYGVIRERLIKIIARCEQRQRSVTARQIELPVYYGPEVAVDIETVARQTQLTCDQVVALHSDQCYRVYALGFRPGFAFMGSVPGRLRVPRKTTPRLKVPRGAVAVAEAQTAVYPSSSPGGWNIIGNCPLILFDHTGTRPNAFLQVGDQVCFRSITRDRFVALGGELSAR